MKIVADYSFNNGKELITKNCANLLSEIYKIIESIDVNSCKTKESKEKTMNGKLLYSPVEINKLFKIEFGGYDWAPHKEYCNYEYGNYSKEYICPKNINNAYREMDFVKNRLGVEVQFGKYAFMVYNVCAKMTIFKNFDVIDYGVEIVPVKNIAKEMSTGVSYFEQFAWDLEKRGVSNIDTPVLILGIDS